jgi:predicted MPP superfamily phosphohydrolase
MLHRALLKPLVLERMPWWLVAAMLLAITGLTGAIWRGRIGTAITVWLLALAAMDWLSLALLPRLKRSFGPVNPPLIALTFLRAAVALLFGVIGQWGIQAAIASAVVQAALSGITLYGLWIEPFRIGITYQTLQSPKLDPDKLPIRVLHLGDLHVERETVRERRLQQVIDGLAPDVILFSGDFVNLSYIDDPEAFQAIQRIVGRWEAPYGVFAVSGTPLVETPETIRQFIAGTGVRWLQDEIIDLEIRGQRLSLLGVTCVHNIQHDAARTRQLVEQTPDDRFRLLLIHAPDIAPEASEMGIDLYVSGHTHGGQWRVPFVGAVITSSALGKQFEMGRYAIGGMTLYVTRGIGMEGASAPRARLFCPPEVILWTLTGQATNRR